MFSLSAPYWISIALVALGLILLALIVWHAARDLRATKALADASRAVFSSEIGLLRARRAALGVGLRQWRRRESR